MLKNNKINWSRYISEISDDNFIKYNFIRVRSFLILFNNLIIVNVTVFLSYLLRTEKIIDFLSISELFYIVNFTYLISHLTLNIENQYFRFFNFKSLKIYLFLSLIYLFVLLVFTFLYNHEIYLPRSISIIYPTLLTLIFLFQRLIISKFFNFIFFYNNNKSVVIGFDIKHASEISKISNIKYYIDNKKNNLNRVFNGSKIISSINFFNNLDQLKFDKIIIYDEKFFNKIKFDLIKFIINKKIKVQLIDLSNNLKLVPYFDFNYFFERKNKFNKIDNDFENKSILITGAGGSVGSGIVNQFLKLKFKKLVLIDNSEYNLFSLQEKINKKNISFNLLNFDDLLSISKLIKNNKIDIIIHAAAYKHVPLVEQNIFSSIKNNFINTHNFIELSCKLNVPYFCLISSDKAVRPSNIMGATKRLAELSILYHNNVYKNLTLNCVRFGNVINSSGSVLPKFKKQINSGGPVTITHKNVVRYFMTIEEASNLVLSSYKISKGGEIFLLDMGEPIRIYDLAKKMIQFSGKNLQVKKNSGDISIKFVGLRRGEKLIEELLIDNNSIKTSLSHIFQSVENNITNNEYQLLFKKILHSFKTKNLSLLLKVISIKTVGYKNK